jgi:hypothetical protein
MVRQAQNRVSLGESIVYQRLLEKGSVSKVVMNKITDLDGHPSASLWIGIYKGSFLVTACNMALVSTGYKIPISGLSQEVSHQILNILVIDIDLLGILVDNTLI